MKQIVLFFLLLICYSTQAQKIYIVPFEKKISGGDVKYSSSSFIIPKKIDNYSLLKGIPSLYKTFRIYSVTLNPEQEMYDKYLNKQITRLEYDKYIQENDIDTTLFTVDTIRNEFYLYIGINKDTGIKCVIVDSNNNLDFSDEQPYIFYLKDEDLYNSEKRVFPNINIESLNGIVVHLSLDPFNSKGIQTIVENEINSDEDRLFEVVFETRDFMQGKIKINGNNIYISDMIHNNLLYKQIKKSYPFLFNSEDTVLNSTIKQIGDTISFAGRKIYIQKANGNSLYLEDFGIYTDSSRVNSFLPSLYSFEIQTNKSIHLNRLIKNKYVFIDFWGSWCGPCIASLPKLKNFYNKIKDREDVLLIGIALEDKKDLGKLQKIIKDNNVEWLNVWNEDSTRKILSSTHGKLSIEQFPTYMIIDNTGRIVYRETSMFKTEKAIDFFIDLITE